MNTLQAKGCWNIAKGRLKQRLAHLMEDELQFSEGKEDELLGRIQKRKGQEIQNRVPAADSCSACHRQKR
jgi:uncharacterized protein YjbJ (UPF0337 family)